MHVISVLFATFYIHKVILQGSIRFHVRLESYYFKNLAVRYYSDYFTLFDFMSYDLITLIDHYCRDCLVNCF